MLGCKCWFGFVLPFLMEIFFIFVTPCFPRADPISSSVANANSTPDNSLGSVAFGRMKSFYFQCVFCLSPVVYLDKQVTIACFLNSFRTSSCRYYFFY